MSESDNESINSQAKMTQLSYTQTASDESRSKAPVGVERATKSVRFRGMGESTYTPIPKTESHRLVVKELGLYIIYPWNRAYKFWWANSVVWSILTIFFETYQIAFGRAGLYPYDNGVAVFSYVFNGIFLVDILVTFNLAYYNEDDELVVDRVVIAKKYLSLMFWVDLLGVIPFYIIVLACTGLLGVDNRTTQYLALLRLFRMVRLHRVSELFERIKYSASVSFMTLTLIRNFGAALVWTHFAACVMYFIAHQYEFDPDKTWIGGLLEDYGLLTLEDKRDIHQYTMEKYLTSMYWSIVTFTTVGYGDFSPVNPAEQIFGMIYMLLNMILVSWMIGSMTLLIVKNDEETGVFRDTMTTLDQYSKIHNFDKKFVKRLKRQVEIDFKHRDTSDEVVLEHFPSTTRRKVLRRLYLPSLKRCRLMRNVRQQFMDAFFRVCKVEVISPGEDIVQRGNIAADLYFLLEGTARLLPWDSDHSDRGDDGVGDERTRNTGTSIADSEVHKGELSHGFRRHNLDEGEFINEISFFTETPQSNTIRSSTLCKTLTLPRYAYKSLIEDHPGSLSKILNNLLNKVEELAKEVGVQPRLSLPSQIAVLKAGSEFDIGAGDNMMEKTVERVQAEVAYTAARDVIQMHINKQQDDHTTTFLYAASRDDTATLRLMLDQSFDPNSKDYDNRTALMVSAMKGNIDTIALLLEYQANPNMVDVHGTSALLEATKRGHDDVMALLLNRGATLCLDEMTSASTLCQAVFDGDMVLLERLLKAKIDVNAGDYDKRTAGHIAVADGNLQALKVLMRYGVDLSSRDRWGNTINDEAVRNEFKHILEFLKLDARKSETKESCES